MIPWLGPGRTGYSLRGGCRIARLGLGSMEGVTAIAATSAQAYRAVQLAGASYLLLLGIRNWRVTGAALPDTAAGQINAPGYRWGGFATGLLSDLPTRAAGG